MPLSQRINISSSRYVLFFLLGIDFAFIVASLIYLHVDFLPSLKLLYVEKDNGYAETFQYLKFILIIVLLVALAKLKKSQLASAWALVFSILLLDDSLQLHERLGKSLSQWLSIPGMYYLRAVDYGELLIYALWGVIAVIALVTAAWIDRSLFARQVSKGLLLSLVGLIGFGGIVDIIHVFAQNYFQLSRYHANLLGVVEDGGEMLVISVTVWFVHRLYLQMRHQRYLEVTSVSRATRAENITEPSATARKVRK